MTITVALTHQEVLLAARSLAKAISELLIVVGDEKLKLWGAPRGGVSASYLLSSCLAPIPTLLVETPEEADVLVDDLADSGSTILRYQKQFPDKVCGVLFNKTGKKRTEFLYGEERSPGEWLSFPWERSNTGVDHSPFDIVTRLLEFVGEDPSRNGLQETPQRMIKAWEFFTSGYQKNPADVLKSFEDGAQGYDEMVVVNGIPVMSLCEHHGIPFFGHAHIAYIPNGRVLGLSKFARLVEVFARRLQVQERMTVQIADALQEHLQPKGVGVILECRHLCMEMRGVRVSGAVTITDALRGAFKEGAVRHEFLSLRTGRV